jgi:hypothetical protein
MVENAGSDLEVEIGVTLNRLSRQLAQAEARFTKAAQKVERDFNRSNDDVMKRAVENYNRANQEAARTTAAFASANSGLSQSFQRNRFAIQNAAFQVQDFAVQVAGGTSATRAFAQQAPQLLSALGPIGTIVGTLAAVGLPLLATAFFNTGDAAKTTEENLRELESALQALRQATDDANQSPLQLMEAYGFQSENAQRFLDIQREIARIEAERAAGAARQSAVGAFGDFGGLTRDGFARNIEALDEYARRYAEVQAEIAAMDATQENAPRLAQLNAELLELTSASQIVRGANDRALELAETLGITRDAAIQLVDAMLAVGEADGPAQQAIAAERLASLLADATNNFRDASEEARQLGFDLYEAVLAGLQFETLDLASPISRAIEEAGGLSAALDGAFASAVDLAAAMWSVVSARASLSATANTPAAGGPAGAPISAIPQAGADDGIAPGRPEARPVDIDFGYIPPTRSSGGGRARSGGGSSRAEQPDLSWWSDLVGRVREAESAFEDYNQTIERGADALTDFFTSMMDGSKSAKEALADLLIQMGRVQLQRGLLGLGQSGGAIGGLFSMLGQSLTPSFEGGGHTGSGPRIGGIDGRGGFAAIVHPDERIIDMRRGGGGGGGSGRIELVIRQEPGAVAEIAANTAGAIVQQYDRALPGRVSRIQSDRRMR